MGLGLKFFDISLEFFAGSVRDVPKKCFLNNLC